MLVKLVGNLIDTQYIFRITPIVNSTLIEDESGNPTRGYKFTVMFFNQRFVDIERSYKSDFVPSTPPIRENYSSDQEFRIALAEHFENDILNALELTLENITRAYNEITLLWAENQGEIPIIDFNITE